MPFSFHSECRNQKMIKRCVPYLRVFICFKNYQRWARYERALNFIELTKALRALCCDDVVTSFLRKRCFPARSFTLRHYKAENSSRQTAMFWYCITVSNIWNAKSWQDKLTIILHSLRARGRSFILILHEFHFTKQIKH